MPAPLHTSNPAEFLRLEGLYIFEQNPPGFVRGASLGTVGVFGPTTKGPVDTPVLITSETRFLEVFGGRDFGGGGALVNKTWRSLLNKPFGSLFVVRAAAAGAVLASFSQDDAADGTGTEIVGHSGSQEKTKTWMALWPGQKLGGVVMSNSEYANPGKLAARLLEVVMPQDMPPPGR